VRDITTRKLAEERLQRNEERLNQAIRVADASHFKCIGPAVGQLRDPSSLPLLFDRLETRGKDGRVIVEA